MTQPWLSAYAPTFQNFVDDLEPSAMEQHQMKQASSVDNQTQMARSQDTRLARYNPPGSVSSASRSRSYSTRIGPHSPSIYTTADFSTQTPNAPVSPPVVLNDEVLAPTIPNQVDIPTLSHSLPMPLWPALPAATLAASVTISRAIR
jgi:hypothetical protein